MAVLTLGMLVVARTQSLVAAAALTLIGMVAARHAATKAAIATLGVLSLAQVPWIASVFMASCVWLALAHRHRTWAWLGEWMPALRGPGGVVAVLMVRRRWGISSSIVAHIIADLIIFTAVLPLVLFTGWAT